MNYHLMPDDKFINDFIDDAESVSKGQNVYIIQSSRETAKHAKHPRLTFVSSLKEYLKELSTKLIPKDQIFIHWLHNGLFDFILSLPQEIKVGLFFWGGDLVEDPHEVYSKFNYEPLTLKYYRKYLHLFSSYFRLYRNPLNSIRHIKWKLQHDKKVQEKLKMKHIAIARIDYFLNWVSLDYQWLKERVSGFNAEYKYFFYGIGEQTDVPIPSTPDKKEKNSLVIWLGNSATLANNHLDAFRVLSRFKKENILIYCPLNYGEPLESHYTQTVIQTGKKIFGEKFQPITQFMNRKAYYQLLQEVDVAVMFHNRTQAGGNVRTFMQMGKKIFMQKQSTLFQLFRNSGAKIFATDELSQMNIHDLSSPLSQDEVLKNRNILNQIINHEEKMESLRSVLSVQ